MNKIILIIKQNLRPKFEKSNSNAIHLANIVQGVPNMPLQAKQK